MITRSNRRPEPDPLQTSARGPQQTHLDVHLYDGFPDQRGAKEGPEGHQEMTTSDPSQVEQRVGNLPAQKVGELAVLPTLLTSVRGN